VTPDAHQLLLKVIALQLWPIEIGLAIGTSAKSGSLAQGFGDGVNARALALQLDPPGANVSWLTSLHRRRGYRAARRAR
jgi:hypothetical protein